MQYASVPYNVSDMNTLSDELHDSAVAAGFDIVVAL